MNQKLVLIDVNKHDDTHLFAGANDEVNYYKIENACYLFTSLNGRNCGYLIKESFFESDFVLFKMLAKIEQFLNGRPDMVKIIGPTLLASKVEKVFHERKLKLDNVVYRNHEYELYHYFETGQLRLSKEIAAQEKKSGTHKGPIKVLIVDDSPTIRNLLSSVLKTDPELKVVAMAESPLEVEDLIKKHKPDVITLDIHMPVMDGVSLLKIISPKYKIPTVMISSISKDDGPMVFDALENGAIDYIQKPSLKELDQVAPHIVERVKAAASAKIHNKVINKSKKSARTQVLSSKNLSEQLIVIGSSTGGTEALKDILMDLPPEIPPILIVQHIPAVFSLAFAKRLNDLCPFEVKEAADGDEVKAGRVLIAPGGKQMKLVPLGSHSKNKFKVNIVDEPPVNRHKPSVDYLFDSVEKLKVPHVTGVILTGMGADGAKGLLGLKQMGAHTIAQNEESCVVFGMPKEAIKLGAASEVKALDEIAGALLDQIHGKVSKAS